MPKMRVRVVDWRLCMRSDPHHAASAAPTAAQSTMRQSTSPDFALLVVATSAVMIMIASDVATACLCSRPKS